MKWLRVVGQQNLHVSTPQITALENTYVEPTRIPEHRAEDG
jgi:hypothetical protein